LKNGTTIISKGECKDYQYGGIVINRSDYLCSDEIFEEVRKFYEEIESKNEVVKIRYSHD
jgi:hypothetical protein